MKWRNSMVRNMASRISELLTQQKLTQKELSQQTGITESSISHYVKGDRVPRGANLTKLASALGTTTDYLLKEENDSVSFNSEVDEVKMLIARNACKMTKAERYDLIRILMEDE